MASLPALFRTSLRLGSTQPCTCTCTRSLSSSLPRTASNPSKRPPAGATPRFADVDWSDGSVAQKKGPTPTSSPSAPPTAPRSSPPPPPPPSTDRSPPKLPTKLRKPWKPRGPARKGREPRHRPITHLPDPRLPIRTRLPPPSSTPSTADLSPEVLHEYRLALITQMGRIPTSEELEQRLPQWLGSERTKEKEKLRQAFFDVVKAQKKEEQLDIAWEWARTQEEKAGVKRSEQDQKKDVVVRARVLERARLEEERKKEHQRRKEKKGLLVAWPKELGADGEGDVSSSSAPSYKDWEPTFSHPDPPEWFKHKQVMKAEFPTGWAPPKRISREAIDLLRLLQRSDPTVYTTPVLAERFKISPESVRRILKSQFELSEEEKARREAKRLRAIEERRAQEAAEGKTWAGDWMGERGEMLKIREGGLVTAREAKKPKSRKQQEEAEERKERLRLKELEQARESEE